MRSLGPRLILAVVLLLAMGSVSFAITNGVPDGNAHPYVGLIVFFNSAGPVWRCSGSLLSPTKVLTAGHCTAGTVSARVWFQEMMTDPAYPNGGPASYDGVTFTNPDFCVGCGNGVTEFITRDVGVVRLVEPVPPNVVGAYATLPQAGFVDALPNKTKLDLVGYGFQEQIHGGGIPVWIGAKNRLVASSELVSGKFSMSDEFLRIALNPGGGSGGTCFGDSGGPDLLAGSSMVLGVNSFMTNNNCAGTGYSQRVDIQDVLDWIASR
ncbi:MAG TPA: S1 family peptidase [bacterium]|jgi:hypothetical protein